MLARTAICALSLFAAPMLFAQPASPAMHAALERLVASQNLAQNWPLLLQNIGAGSTRTVLQGAFDALDGNQALTQAQRARARDAIEGLAPQIAADVSAMLAKIDARTLMLGMTEKVYPKYYSLREIQEMSSFYESPAYRKVATMGIQAQGEISRTGQNPALVWARYDARLTPEEKRALAAFQNSPTGQKTHSASPQVQKESLRYLHARTDGMLNDVMVRYKDRIEKAVRDAAQN
jgi:hypothetical protein